jgi:hypothetical protein
MSVPELRPAAEIAAEVQGQAEKKSQTDADPKAAEEYTFEFSHTDSRGKVWSGKVTNRVLTIRQRQQAKVVKATLSGNLPVSALDADIWNLNEMVAHLSVSLVKRPKWASELTDLYDEEIITKLYEEVIAHENYFRGPREDPSVGEKPSE